jgi:uncharacterized protein (DUF1330 family)
VEVVDEHAWQRYRGIAAAEIAKYGGRYLVRGVRPEVAEAGWDPPQPERQQVIVVEFSSMERLHSWYQSAEYAEALVFRKVAAKRRLLFVRGVDEPDAT